MGVRRLRSAGTGRIQQYSRARFLRRSLISPSFGNGTRPPGHAELREDLQASTLAPGSQGAVRADDVMGAPPALERGGWLLRISSRSYSLQARVLGFHSQCPDLVCSPTTLGRSPSHCWRLHRRLTAHAGRCGGPLLMRQPEWTPPAPAPTWKCQFPKALLLPRQPAPSSPPDRCAPLFPLPKHFSSPSTFTL